MAIHQDENGIWHVQVQRKGIPRIRRSGFLSKDAAIVFERSYLEKHRAAAGSSGDGRLLSELIELWFVRHGAHLVDGKRQRRELLAIAAELKNPVASRCRAISSWPTVTQKPARRIPPDCAHSTRRTMA